jgi:DNA-directed RNA polymerase subunit M/transcription elongation factor TFIIS
MVRHFIYCPKCRSILRVVSSNEDKLIEGCSKCDYNNEFSKFEVSALDASITNSDIDSKYIFVSQ